MTSASPAARLLRSAGLQPSGPVKWGDPVPFPGPGVYVIEAPLPHSTAPLDVAAVRAWIARVPSIRLDGEAPSPTRLAARLSSFWIAREGVVYVGLAGTSVSKRVRQYYRTPLGDPGPHAGGHWIKTLSVLPDLRVWWAETPGPRDAEDRLLRAFAQTHVGKLPFANLQGPGGRKPHGVTGSLLPRRPSGGRQGSGMTRASRSGARSDERLAKINAALERLASEQPSGEIGAVEAGAELARLRLLSDSRARPGLPLRELLRSGKIRGAYQDSSRRWHIRAWSSGRRTPPQAQASCLLPAGIMLAGIVSLGVSLSFGIAVRLAPSSRHMTFGCWRLRRHSR